MSLLDDVSIVITPNAYKAGTLYAVIPTPTEGSELVTNGDFATDTDWSKGGSFATITGGEAVLISAPNASDTFYQAISGYANKRVIVVFEITDYTEGAINVSWEGVNGNNASGLGVYSQILTLASGNANFNFRTVGTTTLKIDNVSVKEYTSADMDVTRATAATRVDEDGLVNYAEILGSEEVTNGDFATDSNWNKDANWSIANGKATSTGSGRMYQRIPELEGNVGTVVQVTFDIVERTSGGVVVNCYGGSSSLFSTVGTHSFVTTTTNSLNLYFNNSGAGNLVGSIDNVSVKEVTRDNVPRIDYTGGGCPHILAEPMRTNLIPYSEDLTQWNKGNLTISSDAIVSPDGTQNADTLNVIDDNDFIYEGATTTASTEYVFSFYVKRGTIAESSLKLAVYDDTNNAFIVSNISYSSSDSEWTRVTQSFTTPVGCILIRAYAFRNTSTTLGTFSVWGAQLEEGSYATSYIPNFGTSAGVTRNQDIFTRDGIGSLINSTEGVLFVEMAALSDDGTFRSISLSNGTPTNRVTVRYNTTSNSISAFVYQGSSTILSYNNIVTDVKDFHKLAIKYKSGDLAFWVDGIEVATSTTSFTFLPLTELDFDRGGGDRFFFGKVKQLQVYNTALTDEQLLQLTGESGTDFYESYAEMAAALTYTLQ